MVDGQKKDEKNKDKSREHLGQGHDIKESEEVSEEMTEDTKEIQKKVEEVPENEKETEEVREKETKEVKEKDTKKVSQIESPTIHPSMNSNITEENKYAEAKKFIRIWSRRGRSKLQHMSAGFHTIGPVMFLLTSTAIGIASTLSTLYATSYSVDIDGVPMGVVENQDIVLHALSDVTAQGVEIFGEDYQLPHEVEYHFGLYLKAELADSSKIEHYLYSQLDELGSTLARYAVELDGKQIAIVETEKEVEEVLDHILNQYADNETLSAEFLENIELIKVYQGIVMSASDLQLRLTANTTGETAYTVVAGDTFNAIAYNNDMSMTELMNLNPSLDPNRLYIGDTLQVKETIPLLSVITKEELNYSQSIPCPVEEVDDPNSYIGNSKIIQTGVEGEAQVVAHVTYLNGVEKKRDIIESTTISEPTTTIRAVGIAERPKTASYGSYIWPTSGRISSYFGGRMLSGSYNYHSGLDIAASYGTPVYAADGGTVTFSGWRASYGNLVIITHDNGAQTYYAHNSSLLVSSGQKVYRGQQIAKVGSTGNSTGNHLHFEIRIGGQAVNPLGYLP